jgi:hypothetical protein
MPALPRRARSRALPTLFPLCALLTLAATSSPTASAGVIDSPAPRLSIVAGQILGSETSTTFAGYRRLGGDSSATAKIQVPSTTCDETDSGLLTGLITYDATGLINGGGGALVFCDDAVLSVAPVVIDSHAQLILVDEPVTTGDKVVVTYLPDATSGTATITLADRKQRWSYTSEPFEYFATDHVQFGDNQVAMDGKPVPPPTLGKHKISKVAYDGLALERKGSTKITMVDAEGVTLIAPGRVRAAHFKLTSPLPEPTAAHVQ